MKVPAGIGLRVDSVHHGSQSMVQYLQYVLYLGIILNHIDASKTTNSFYIPRHEMTTYTKTRHSTSIRYCKQCI